MTLVLKFSAIGYALAYALVQLAHALPPTVPPPILGVGMFSAWTIGMIVFGAASANKS